MAKKTKITSPVEGFSGVGVGGLVFTEGVAETDNEAIINYCRGAGYGIGKTDQPPPARVRRSEPATPPVDARDAAEPAQVGSALRDAAVDPRDEDFMAPVGAGEADPHGPEVVSAQVHATGAGDVAPGPVPDAADEQEAKEDEHALDAMAEPLTEAPAKSAKADDWKAWARQVESARAAETDVDVTQETLDKIDGSTRAELMATYGPKTD